MNAIEKPAMENLNEVIYGYIYTKVNGPGEETTLFAKTVPTVFDGWSTVAGIMTVTNKQALHDRMSFQLSGTHVSMNVFYDDFSIKLIPKSCHSVVLNDDFEDGDSSLWHPTWRPYSTYSQFSLINSNSQNI